MKKFHKRAAVFLTAATLAGLPAGAFFYSSPGSLTVWADNVEVESSEESSPEDVDFSDGSEVEIHADPVEQAQEDAGNDVTETPEVGITFTEPEGWQTDTATVKIQVEDTKNTGAFSIAKVEARLSENGGWSDITGNMEVSISSNCSVYVRVTDQNGNTYEQNRYIECFDKTKPTIIAAAKNGILIVQGVDAESGIAALYVNGNEFTELTNNTLNVRLQKADTSYEYFTLQAKDKAGNMSEIYKVGNPYYENPDAVKENTEVSGTEQNAASLPADGTASKPTSATATVTEHQTTNETATAPTEPENTGNETDTEADTGRVQGESSASGMTTGTVQDKGGKEFYTIKTKSDKVFYLIVDKDKTDESLYEKKLVTYPRTDSQYLTDDMVENAFLVIDAVNRVFPEISMKGSEPEIKRLLNSKKVSDHHAIIPTVEITNMDLKALPGGEKEILMLIASKLLCASEQEYIYESIKTEISCHGELFTASGKNVLQYGWKEVEERFFKSYGKNAEKPEEEESDFPDIKIGQVFECVVVKFSEHFTAPPKHYTEDTLLSAMEHAGSSDTIEDAERKGLGTPATRAAIIEKLIEKGFIERKKKQILPTADGRNLIRILPEMIKSPKLTAEWENDLTLISRGQKNVEEFLFEIEKMVTKLVSDNGQPVEEYQKLFSDGRKEIGKCPRCDNKVYVGKRNYYCSGSDCSFTLWKNNRFFESQGKILDEATVRKLLSEKQVHFKDLVSEKTKRKYEATIKMEVSETGNPKFQLIFPERKKGKKNEE